MLPTTSNGRTIAKIMTLFTIVILAYTFLNIKKNSALARFTPQAGYLYLIDRGEDKESQILVMELNTSNQVAVIPAGFDPQVVLSKDGNWLYIAETVFVGEQPIDQIRVIDTSNNWETKSTINTPHRLRSTVSTLPGVLASSDDNRYLYIQRYTNTASDKTADYSVVTYDLLKNTLESEISLPKYCTTANIMPSTEKLVIGCYGPSRSITFADPLTGKSTNLIFSDPLDAKKIPSGNTEEDIASITMSHDKKYVYAISKGAKLLVIDVASESITNSFYLEKPADLMLPYYGVQLSQDDSEIYIGLGSKESVSQGKNDEIHIYNTSNWSFNSSISLPESSNGFISDGKGGFLSLGPSGRQVKELSRTGLSVDAYSNQLVTRIDYLMMSK